MVRTAGFAETQWLMSLTTKSSDGSRNTRSRHTKNFVAAATAATVRRTPRRQHPLRTEKFNGKQRKSFLTSHPTSTISIRD
jgi:hypothetical protein